MTISRKRVWPLFFNGTISASHRDDVPIDLQTLPVCIKLFMTESDETSFRVGQDREKNFRLFLVGLLDEQSHLLHASLKKK